MAVCASADGGHRYTGTCWTETKSGPVFDGVRRSGDQANFQQYRERGRTQPRAAPFADQAFRC